MPFVEFKGKEPVRNHHLAVPHHELLPRAKLSLTSGNVSLNDNLLIHGDNLAVLKSLLPIYGGKVNCIYIDPPYNTGNENWIYNDRVASPMIAEWLGKIVDRDDLARHDKWLCMMWPRLQLLRELLAENGVIFVSIDDNEQHHLRMIMSEIFGEDNFVANIVWQKKYSPANDAKYFSDNHDFIVCFAKNKGNGNGSADYWRRKLLPRTEKQDSLYKYDDGDGRGTWQSGDLSVKTYSAEYDYPIINPATGKTYNPPEGRCWVTSREKMQSWVDDNRIFFPPGGKSVPRLKRYLAEVQQGIVPLTIWTYEEVGHTDSARKHLKEIFHDKDNPFDNPKPVGLIKRIVQIATEKDAIILDAFAGSGTTAEAVLELNKEDDGARKFILAQCDEYDKKEKKMVDIAKTVTAERIHRVIKGVPNAKNGTLRHGLGGTLNYWELGEPLQAINILKAKTPPSWEEMARFVFFTATGEQWNPDKANIAKNYLGDSKRYAVYLFYLPDFTYLKESVFTLKEAEKLRPSEKPRLVFAPTKAIAQRNLNLMGIEFAQLPFEIYKLEK